MRSEAAAPELPRLRGPGRRDARLLKRDPLVAAVAWGIGEMGDTLRVDVAVDPGPRERSLDGDRREERRGDE